jgi:RNA polymerase sigma-70 factor, ECF subfamily
LNTEDRTRLFETLIHEHQSRLRAYVYSRTADPEAADDVVQEVYLVAYRKLDSFDQEAPAWPWLKGIARNELREHWRIAERNSSHQKLLSLIAQHKMSEDADEAQAGDNDWSHSLQECLNKLAEKPRNLLRQIYVDGLKSEEIAKSLGVNAVQIRVYLHRVRRTLRDCLTIQRQREQREPTH